MTTSTGPITAETLLDLLPAIYRLRDTEVAHEQGLLTGAELGELALLQAGAGHTSAEQARLRELRERADRGPLGSLLAVIAEQIAILGEDLDRLYDDQFIETCAEWVAPYIGDLVGYRPLHGVVPRLTSSRAEVANQVAYVSRKGTPAMLEQLARDVTGWPARVVEYFSRVGWTQHMNHVRPDAAYAPDLRASERLLWSGTAFDTTLYTVNVRRVEQGGLPYNLPNVGLFLWRLGAHSLTRTPVVADGLDPSGRLARVHPLGMDQPLFTRPRTEDRMTELAGPLHLPLPIPLRWMASRRDQYYGPALSVHLEIEGATADDPPDAVPSSDVSVCDLGDVLDAGGNVVGWAHVPDAGSGRVAIDPSRGRIAFGNPPPRPVLATFHYGFSAPIGGGEYERGEASPLFGDVRTVTDSAALAAAVATETSGTIELSGSGRYEAPPTIAVAAGQTLVLRATNGARPLLTADSEVDLALGPGATLVLDGLLLTGAPLRLPDAGDDEPRTLVLRHCTVVPGAVGSEADAPGLVVEHAFAHVEAEASILAPLHVVEAARVVVRDSIIDATGEDLVAYRGPEADLAPGGSVTLLGVTVVGKVHARQIEEATNTLFVARLKAADAWTGPVWADRRQVGCIRFSFVPDGSRTPRRFQCHPDEGDPPALWPHFTSLRYGDPGYGQVSIQTDDVLRRGADDEGEMGAFHLLYQPHRETNLRIRLAEYLRFGLEAGIYYAT
ncbi:MAG: hypothetical protein M0R73_02340 [Dehalococcoidia bacterium]|nr:hypothetical protein [Dehalococcoidia bacterium]